MSYEIAIRSDDLCMNAVPKEQLGTCLAEIFGLEGDTGAHFCLVDGNGVSYGDIDLVVRSAGGEFVSAIDHVNCILVHIASAYVSDKRYFVMQLCHAIGKSLGWRVFDEQAGRYLD